jgi:hypothetical protein
MRTVGFARRSAALPCYCDIQRLLPGVKIPATVTHAEHFVEMSLGIPESTVDGLV